MIDLKPGDSAFVKQMGVGATIYTHVLVKKVTTKQIVIENGNRYKRENGYMIGNPGSYSYVLVEPTEEILKEVASFNLRDSVRTKWDRLKGLTANPMHMDIEKATRLGNALDEVFEALK